MSCIKKFWIGWIPLYCFTVLDCSRKLLFYQWNTFENKKLTFIHELKCEKKQCVVKCSLCSFHHLPERLCNAGKWIIIFSFCRSFLKVYLYKQNNVYLRNIYGKLSWKEKKDKAGPTVKRKTPFWKLNLLSAASPSRNILLNKQVIRIHNIKTWQRRNIPEKCVFLLLELKKNKKNPKE